jgi:hypothetical protein
VEAYLVGLKSSGGQPPSPLAVCGALVWLYLHFN